MTDVRCLGDEPSLMLCAFSGWGADCSHTQDVTVTCYGKQPFPSGVVIMILFPRVISWGQWQISSQIVVI